MSKKPPKRSPHGTPPSGDLGSKKPPKRSPSGTPPPGKLPPKHDQRFIKPQKQKIIQEQKIVPVLKKSQTRARAKELKTGHVKILTLIDTYGWAYDEGCKGLYKELRKLHPDWILHKAVVQEVYDNQVNPKDYDAVFVWAWWNIHGIWDNLLDTLDEKKSILVIAGEHPIRIFNSLRKSVRRFHYIGGNNFKITSALKELSTYRKIHQLEYGVDLERFKPTTFPKTFTVGWAGHQNRGLKRHHLAFEACNALNIPLKTAGHITTGAYIPPKEMPRFYRDISCLLITSDSEAHPLVYYEALASGKPVISTLVGDIPLTAKEGENGFYLPIACTREDIMSRLQKLRANPQLMKRMGAKGRRDVEEKWNWGIMAPKYLSAIDDLTGKFTACMLVSRDNELMQQSVQSVVAQKPAEFRAYIDLAMIPDSSKAEKILKKAGAKIFYQNTTDAEDHHKDVVKSVHRAISEAEYPRVLWTDDDDLIIGSVRNLVHLVGDGVGIVYGNVKQRFKNGVERVRHGGRIKIPLDMARMKGSVVFYNRDAFMEIHDNIDHGYFWDYKIGYWMMRAGYNLRYFNQTMSIQNVNPSPSPKRKSLYEAWPSMVKEMNKIPLKRASAG